MHVCVWPGRTALVTGARVKIGFYIALKLLRNGCRVLAQTRFGHDAIQRCARNFNSVVSRRWRVAFFSVAFRVALCAWCSPLRPNAPDVLLNMTANSFRFLATRSHRWEQVLSRVRL